MSQKGRRTLFGGGGRGSDVVLFGRVVSAGLLIGGYAFAGVYIAQWMKSRGYTALVVGLTPFVVGIFGIWQGWLYVRQTFMNGSRQNEGAGSGKERGSPKPPQ
ncbi:MAG: hypothetical protein LBT65_03855 [Synergistaceae bacterium]|jgi:hypothetical protein|nr:hypothetical protein [Synergistaceae bacterium]